MKTFTATPADLRRDWYVIDAEGKALGRLATEIAKRLCGKHKAEYTPHIDTGDYIVVVNARGVRVSGNKSTDKTYYSHSGYPGAIKSISFAKQIRKKPEKIIEMAVRGMLPKGPLGREMFRKLKVYPDAAHKHTAQQPRLLEI